ncbi:dTMP kinase [Aquibaculum sediminis]|uniref:dTMP kinase n=1 Tax=Aquibaculum sediminis TaxID=3231907 RepID=UPI0034526652
MTRGKFITLEGGEGAGKSTHCRALAAALRSAGLEVLETREPGGSPGAEEIRELLVHGAAGRWDAQTEALLVFAARRDHFVTRIEPALAQGAWVICDRFADSTYAYQGYGRELPLEPLRALYRFTVGEKQPDLTLLFDLPVELGLARAAGRHGAAERFEGLTHAFHERVRQGFLAMAAAEPLRFARIDATQPVEAVTLQVRQSVGTRLGVSL